MKEKDTILYSWNNETKEFYFLGHKIDYVNNPGEFKKYLTDLISENKCLKKRLSHLLESKTIRMLDEIDPETEKYRYNIACFDNLALSYSLSYLKVKEDDNQTLYKYLKEIDELKEKNKFLIKRENKLQRIEQMFKNGIVDLVELDKIVKS